MSRGTASERHLRLRLRRGELRSDHNRGDVVRRVCRGRQRRLREKAGSTGLRARRLTIERPVCLRFWNPPARGKYRQSVRGAR